MISPLLLSTTDLIRRVALHHLIGYPDGIQTVHLRKLVEESLNKYLPVKNSKNATKYKNSIWDLDKRFPEYVEKDVIAHKNVLLKPTFALFNNVDQIPLPDFETYFSMQHLRYSTELDVEPIEQNGYLVSMRELFHQLADVIKDSEFYKLRQQGKISDGVYDMSKYLEGATPTDMMLYVHLASIVSTVEKALDELFDED